MHRHRWAWKHCYLSKLEERPKNTVVLFQNSRNFVGNYMNDRQSCLFVKQMSATLKQSQLNILLF